MPEQKAPEENREPAPEKIPETPPMPTGSGVFDSRTDRTAGRTDRAGEATGADARELRRRQREIRERS